MIGRIKRFITILQHNLWYGAFIALLALLTGAMEAYSFFGENIPRARLEFMYTLDLVIAYFFLADYLAGLYAAPVKKEYIRRGWLDLLGSIPLSRDLFRALRILRFARLVRLFRLASMGINFRGGVYKMKHHKDKEDPQNKA
ncbi:MAG: ion transporter [Candidatus Spechtbacterales bacterium]|nr:ion transporter [Candidatus Spechtbacterales bacterium]